MIRTPWPGRHVGSLMVLSFALGIGFLAGLATFAAKAFEAEVEVLD